MPGAPLHIAVLGDLHGHFTLAYRVLKRWEVETGTALDLVLQVGDLGAFPPPFRLDDATRRFAERDPDELDFARYHAGEDPEVCEILAPDAPPERRFDADLVFIKGNHEDFEFLASSAGPDDPPVPVDHHGRILHLANGAVWTFARRGHALTIGALGGIAHDEGPPAGPRATSASMFFTANELRRLSHARRGDPPLDVLLTHEPPFGAAARAHPRYAEAGSREIAALLAARAPRFHFCGHYHEPGLRLEVPAARETESYELNAVNFHKPHRLNAGCIGILRWAGRADASFALLDAPWLADFTRHTYRSL